MGCINSKELSNNETTTKKSESIEITEKDDFINNENNNNNNNNKKNEKKKLLENTENENNLSSSTHSSSSSTITSNNNNNNNNNSNNNSNNKNKNDVKVENETVNVLTPKQSLNQTTTTATTSNTSSANSSNNPLQKQTSLPIQQQQQQQQSSPQKQSQPILQQSQSLPPSISSQSSPDSRSGSESSTSSNIQKRESTGGEKKLKLSELLHAEKMKKTPGNSISSSGEGKEGWLYREKEFTTNSNEDPYLKVWVVVAENRLTYFLHKPKGGDYLNDFSARGFLDLESNNGDCRVIERKQNEGGMLSGSIGRYLFRVKEQNTTIIFSATSESERNEWVYLIQEAIRGVIHTPVTPSIPSAPTSTTSNPSTKQETRKTSSAKRFSGFDPVEFPKMVGSLKKKSIEGKKFGFKNIKTRWFRLESGELRYYSEESMRPSKLKGTMSLKGCSLPPGEDNSGENISILRPDGNTLLMIAFSVESARDWRTAIGESIILLNRLSTGQQGGKKRRENLSNVSKDNSTINTTSQTTEIVPKSEETVNTLRTAMQQHFLLNTLLDFTPVLNSLKREIAFPGDVLIWQDSIGDLFFILETGFVDIIKDNTKVAKLGPGKAFGELALINDINRTATVKACNVCIAWTLDRQTMRNVLANQETSSRGNKIAFLKTVQMFVKLSDTTLGQIADVMKLVSYEPNDRIIKQGEVGDQFYIIQSGHALVTQGNKELARLSPGNCFGELALISNEPRKATVTAVDALNCYTIDKQTFTSVLGTLKDAETQSTGITILKKVKLLESLSEKQLVIISRSLETKDYENGENIVNQGDEGDKFYMIASGAVSIYVNHAEVARLNTGSYFGEMALMNDERRNATVTALGPVTCLTLNRSQFVKLLGPLDDILKEEARRREEAARSSGLFGRLQRGLFQKRTSEKKISENTATGVRFNLDEFTSVRILGTGRFGLVKLVQHNGSYKAYALKVLHKSSLEEFKHEQAVINEKNLLQSLDHPFIPAIYGTFQDINSLYILLELIPGGDMWSILYDESHHTQFQSPSKFGGIEVNMAKFYFCNILCAISYLHSNDIIYRDLKPENLVMDRTGYLKLVDFGSAKVLLSSSLTNTICGTPEYLAPEMLAARGHNRAVDFWAIGVFLYELLNRSTPFEQNDTVGIYQKIIHSEETLKECFKPQFEPYAKSLILQLLSNTPGLRIGMLRNGVDDIWNHPFLSDVIADDILCKSIPPPLRPDMDRIMEQTELDKEHQNDEVIPYTGRFDFTSF